MTFSGLSNGTILMVPFMLQIYSSYILIFNSAFTVCCVAKLPDV
jgi:hypothetical protein